MGWSVSTVICIHTNILLKVSLASGQKKKEKKKKGAPIEVQHRNISSSKATKSNVSCVLLLFS